MEKKSSLLKITDFFLCYLLLRLVENLTIVMITSKLIF